MKKALIILILACMFSPLFTSGAYAKNVNEAPTVIPAVREWVGSQGNFLLKDDSKITCKTKTSELDRKISIVKNYFKDMLSIEITEMEDDPSPGDINLILDKSKKDLGAEGYILKIDDIITITAANEQGIFYGCITILQSLYADGYVPKGTAKDYPEYEIRSGMIDVARAYLTLEYVEEITKYMAWFKLNEVQLHINDRGANNYSAFRLESDVPGLTSKDGYYSKNDYRDYQKRMLDYGISVITEIDTPAHSLCFNGVVPKEYMLDENHINISNQDAVKFIKDLFDEYITGDDPVFISKKVHIGTDEYPAEYSEQMRAYTDTLIKHINSRGYTPRFWGSFGKSGFNGNTPVSNKAEANYWAVELSDYKTLFQMGYDIINTCGPVLYVVPGGNYGFADYYNLPNLYKNWFVNYMGHDQSTAVDPNDPQLKGASFALWNDTHTAYGGFSIFDIFDRLKGMVCLISEKTWCGEQTRQINADDFTNRFDILSLKAGNCNPGRTQNLPITTDYDKEIKSVGFPYVASFNINVQSFTDDCVLFGGGDGQVVLNKDGSISLKREGYEFLYKCNIVKNKDTKLKFIADNIKTILSVDDTYYYNPINLKNQQLNDSSTFVFPLEQSSVNLTGRISDLLIDKNNINLNDLKLLSNYALNKPVMVSGLEVNDGRLNEKLAVDGNPDTRLSLAKDKDEQWLIIDLGSEKDINKIVINFFEHIKEYKILVSADGKDFTEVYHEQNGSEREKKVDTVSFDTVKARYVKYLQLKRFHVSEWNAYYSGGISEFEIYGFDMSIYENVLAEANTLISSDESKNALISNVKKAKNTLQNYMDSKDIYITHIDALKEELVAAISAYKSDLTTSISDQPSDDIDYNTEESNNTIIYAVVAVLLIIITITIYFTVLKKNKN